MSNQIKRKIQVAVVYCDQSKQKQLLLLKLIPERGGHWQNVTGHVETGETLQEAAIRELIEETSISQSHAQLIDAKFSFDFTDRFKMERSEHGFIAWVDTNIIELDKTEHTEFKWISLNQVTKEDLGFSTHWDLIKIVKERE